MSKRKRSRRTGPVAVARSGGAQAVGHESAHVRATAWSDLEEAFFAAAPPDDPAPPVAPLQFDDLVSPASYRRPRFAGLRRALREAWRVFDEAMSRPDGRTLWVLLATFMIVIGLSAAVFASRSGSHGPHRGEPPAAASHPAR